MADSHRTTRGRRPSAISDRTPRLHRSSTMEAAVIRGRARHTGRMALSREARRGYAAGLAGAALFGLSAPVTSRLLTGSGTLLVAGLLYAGAAIALSITRQVRGPAAAEAPIHRRDWPLLGAVTFFGGVVGPVLLVVGLRRLTPDAASLLLNLEAPATMVLGVWLFREHLGRRGWPRPPDRRRSGRGDRRAGRGATRPARRAGHRRGVPGVGARQQPGATALGPRPVQVAQLKALGACIPVLVLALLLGEPVGPVGEPRRAPRGRGGRVRPVDHAGPARAPPIGRGARGRGVRHRPVRRRAAFAIGRPRGTR